MVDISNCSCASSVPAYTFLGAAVAQSIEAFLYIREVFLNIFVKSEILVRCAEKKKRQKSESKRDEDG